MVIQPTVFIVDDDIYMRNSLVALLESVGLKSITFASAEEFLETFSDGNQWGSGNPCPRCLLLDVRLSGLSGLGLLERLAEIDNAMPVIIITAYSSVSMAVQAMRAGALDFIEKPFSKQDLLHRIHEAIERDAAFRRQNVRREEILSRFATLSTREREVLDMLVYGNQTQQIANSLKIGSKTVAKHRSRLFEKMRVDNVAALVCMAVKYSLIDCDADLDE